MANMIKEVDKVEVVTLQDNYIDFFAFDDNNQVINRPVPVAQSEKGLQLGQPPLAEHGWSSLISTTTDENTDHLLFDFGWSEQGAANNAKLLNLDLSQVGMMALSHGHIDHFGGIKAMYDLIGNPGLELVLHPAAFRNPRYGKILNGMTVNQPCLTHEFLAQAGVKENQVEERKSLFDENMLFLTGIPRKTEFEKGMPNFFYLDDNGQEKWDSLDDDSAIVVVVKGKGLVVVSGCGHAGIVNTIEYAKEVTGIDHVHAVIGGFHLTGKAMKDRIEPTIQALKKINPDYIVPTHCTGWDAITRVREEMPKQFILNMSGTKFVFSANS